jgi:tetratricopeptide (TPR) repeat protein
MTCGRHDHDPRTTRASDGRVDVNAYRTLLEQKIRERRQTFEEFVEYAERLARDHGEPGSLSVRHLQRLVSGRRSNGQPLGRPLPATARLLEHIFGIGIDELLAPPTDSEAFDGPVAEIRRRLAISSRVDIATVDLLREQLAVIRRIDRELGAVVAYNEVVTKIEQVTSLFLHSLTNSVRGDLAGLLSELFCLAGWQALDLGKLSEAWGHYSEARAAALQAPAPSYLALAEAGRGFTLADAGEPNSAAEILDEAHETLAAKCPPLLRSWLAAARGEAFAACGQEALSRQDFDRASELLPTDSNDAKSPYVALDPVHLSRWRGNALTRFAAREAVDLLTTSLTSLDPSFIRAETALRVDLAGALATIGEGEEARDQARHANDLATRIGSARQQRRLHGLIATNTFRAK